MIALLHSLSRATRTVSLVAVLAAILTPLVLAGSVAVRPLDIVGGDRSVFITAEVTPARGPSEVNSPAGPGPGHDGLDGAVGDRSVARAKQISRLRMPGFFSFNATVPCIGSLELLPTPRPERLDSVAAWPMGRAASESVVILGRLLV